MLRLSGEVAPVALQTLVELLKTLQPLAQLLSLQKVRCSTMDEMTLC